jgi:hypothetical protein
METLRHIKDWRESRENTEEAEKKKSLKIMIHKSQFSFPQKPLVLCGWHAVDTSALYFLPIHDDDDNSATSLPLLLLLLACCSGWKSIAGIPYYYYYL